MLLFFKAVLFTIIVPGTVTVLIPVYILGPEARRMPAAWTFVEIGAVVLMALGTLVYARCLRDFAVRGRGIPAPIDHPKQLVVTGLYRYVRNPMYLGVLLILLGEVVFFRSRALLFYTAAWFALVNAAVLLYEEPALRRKFGSTYERYKAEVGRWIPRRSARP